ncbi:hypothetical protein AJ80_08020 [Polytolypa hystricis UAMH7299]|uniref:Uncharacterized protein n=1 Tax=Polytolypa hystricis (strain UAMH7299) TaxID=1447883 RepID=A0A2B7XEC4_POLH7|nr:hypothetical protein AJ80_08020 [Polytolypa hystricis UAMH7299]
MCILPCGAVIAEQSPEQAGEVDVGAEVATGDVSGHIRFSGAQVLAFDQSAKFIKPDLTPAKRGSSLEIAASLGEIDQFTATRLKRKYPLLIPSDLEAFILRVR